MRYVRLWDKNDYGTLWCHHHWFPFQSAAVLYSQSKGLEDAYHFAGSLITAIDSYCCQIHNIVFQEKIQRILSDTEFFFLVLFSFSSGKDKFKSNCKSHVFKLVYWSFLHHWSSFSHIYYISGVFYMLLHKNKLNFSHSNDLNNIFAWWHIYKFIALWNYLLLLSINYDLCWNWMSIIPLFHQLRTNNEIFLIVFRRNIMQDLKKMTYIKKERTEIFC